MKRLFFLIAGVLCLHLSAQEFDITYSSTESGTVTHSARNSITLAPNYTYNSGTGALTLEILNPVVSGTLQYNSVVDPESRAINTSCMVGSISGSLSVNDKGGSVFSVPIQLPPGVNGLAPSLSLVYSSNLGPGIAGYGWQIGGISTVSRGGKDYYHDGVTRGIELDTTDRFYLDGQRLVNTNTSFYQNYYYVQYQTDNDIFTRVTPKGNTGYFMGADSWFFAETKSGLKYEYGHTTSSKQKIIGADPVVCWYVSNISDLFGNDINYSYIQDNNTMYPAEITYGPNKITFYYKEKTEKNVHYLKGNKIEYWLSLDRIEISYNSVLVKKYEFKYNRLESLYNYYTVLNEIIEYGTGTGRLNSTAFSYQVPGNVSFSSPTGKSHSYLTYNSILCTGDFNGDGKADFVCLPDATKGATWTGIRVYLGDGNDNFTSYFSNTTVISQLKDIRAIDLNADGKDDLVYETGTSNNSNYYFMTCNGSSLSGPYSISLNRTPSQYSGVSGKKRRFIDKLEDDNEVTGADYNGDGAYDICINDNAGNCSVFSLVTSNGNMGTTTMNVKGGLSSSTITGEVLTGDFNGDGKDDVWSIESTGTKIYTLINSDLVLMYPSTFPTSNHFFNLGDFNGDGKTDVFLYGTKSGSTEVDWTTWQIQLSTGAGFEQINIPQKKANLKNDYVRVTDFNGDGTSDLMVTSPNLSWTGTYFYINMTSGIDFYTHYLSSFPMDKNNFFIADYNGDARADIICTDAESSWWTGYKINKSTGNTQILLEKVSNGLGSVQKVYYTKLSQAPTTVYQRGSGAVFPIGDYQGPMTVVSSIQSENGKGGYNTLSFYYEGFKQHLQGKGFLCYTKLRTTDVTNAVYSESINGYLSTRYNVKYYYPRPLKSYQCTVANDTLNRTTYTWSEILLHPSRKYIFPNLLKNLTVNKIAGQAVVDSVVYDNYGNPTTIKKRYSSGPTEITTNTYDNIVSTTQWLLGRPTSTTVQYTKTGSATITRTGTRIFDSNNNHLKSETWFAGTNNQITHRYEYWGYGSVKKQIDSIITGTTRTQQYDYITDHTRILYVTDPLTHVSTSSYDVYGRLETQTDFLGNYLKYTYDELGRQTIIKSSLGTQNTKTLAWETPSSTPKNARYSILSTNNDGSQARQWLDKYGREIRSDIKGFNGTWIYKVTKYNIKNQIDSISEPYYSIASPIWNRILYDNYGRKTNLYTPSGRNSSWTYTGNSVTEITAGKTFTKSINSDGTISLATDAGGTINYNYYSDGKIKSIVAPGNLISKMWYDGAGNQIQLNDTSTGITTYVYNGFGEITSQTNARNQQTSVNYLSDGRIDSKITPEGTTSVAYNANKQISSITSPGNISRSFTYDTKGRISTITDVIPGSSPFITSYRYDVKGRDSTVTHPSGIVEKKIYNSYGYLSSISAGGITRWTVTGMNEFQQLTNGTYGSNLSTTNYYNSYGYLTSVQTGSIRLNAYTFNAATGNLEMRNNVLHMPGAIEYFHNDNLNRLDDVYIGSTTLQDIAYDGNKGGITLKSDVGTMNYSLPEKPYALSSITPSTGIITPAMNDSITYTSFESVNFIKEGTYSASFLYGYDNQRRRMVVQNGSNNVVTRWYPTNRFMKDSVIGTVKKYTYVGGDAYTAPVVAVITNNGSPVYYYLLRDHLGSITHVVNTSNSVVAEYSYDAWGRMRDPSTWNKYAPGLEPALIIADRGFTGHEHLPWFNVINMNGRIYDPLTGQFLSADKYVQNPGYTQNFNRYIYCLNNPLKYSDPSGFIFRRKQYEPLEPPLMISISAGAISSPGHFGDNTKFGGFHIHNGADAEWYATHTQISNGEGGYPWVANRDFPSLVGQHLYNEGDSWSWGSGYQYSNETIAQYIKEKTGAVAYAKNDSEIATSEIWDKNGLPLRGPINNFLGIKGLTVEKLYWCNPDPSRLQRYGTDPFGGIILKLKYTNPNGVGQLNWGQQYSENGGSYYWDNTYLGRSTGWIFYYSCQDQQDHIDGYSISFYDFPGSASDRRLDLVLGLYDMDTMNPLFQIHWGYEMNNGNVVPIYPHIYD